MKTNSYINTLLLACIGVFFLVCSFTAVGQTENDATLQYPTAEDDLNTAKATVKAYENGNWEDLRSFLHKDAQIYGLGNFDSLTVDETLDYWTEGRETAVPELAEEGTWLGVSIPDGPRAGNWIYHWGTNTLSYEDGKKITFPYHVALKMENNKVTESHFYYDNMKIIREMGYAISPPLDENNRGGEIEVIEQN